jgi:hypothetical protein
MPVWTAIVDQNTDPTLTAGPAESTGWAADANNPNHLWWLHRYGSASQTPAQNFAVNVAAPLSVFTETEGKSRPQVRRYAARVSTNFRLAGLTDHHIVKNFSVGGAVRWEDKGSIGYYGITDSNGVYTKLDSSRPIWDSDHFYVDAFVSYKTRMFADKVAATFQFNVRNIQESGGLRPIAAFPDGEVHTWRIVDPRQFFLTASFEL